MHFVTFYASVVTSCLHNNTLEHYMSAFLEREIQGDITTCLCYVPMLPHTESERVKSTVNSIFVTEMGYYITHPITVGWLSEAPLKRT